MPLGLTFVLSYMPPMAKGAWAVASVFVAHLLFRTAYAAVNVPYLAMTARVSADPGDREKAQTLLDEALESYERIGMPRHVEMTQTLLDETADR